jgi:hypothetical protein
MAAGRPSAWRPEFAEQAFKYCLLGATDIQMAEFFGVSNQTFNNWKKKQPALVEALARGKAVANAEVAHSLYKQAIGYEVQEEILKVVGGKVERFTVTKHIPANNISAIFFLKNRDKTNWRDKQDVEHSGRIDYSNLTADDDQ